MTTMPEPLPSEDRPPALGSPVRYAVTLLLALVASGPAFLGAIDDRMSLPSALGRFLVAFVACWVIGALFTFITRVPGSAGADR
jgi:hypothetical protein